MELGVIYILREETNVFDVIAKYGVATTQLANWKMILWTPQMAKKVKKDLKSSGVRLAALWTGYSGTVIWDLIDGPDTMGLIPAYTRKKRIADLKKRCRLCCRNRCARYHHPLRIYSRNSQVPAVYGSS